MSGWQPIETAKSYVAAQGKPYASDTAILLLFAGTKPAISVAYWDEYYAEGGAGCTDGVAWIEPVSGEQVRQHYGLPTHWMPLPPPPEA